MNKRLFFAGVVFLSLSILGAAQTVVVPPLFDGAHGFHESMAAVSFDRSWGYIDRNRDLVIDFEYLDARDFYEGLAAVRTETGWGFIDTAGQMVIQPTFADVKDFGEGRAAVKVDNPGGGPSWQFIDRSGKTVAKGFYDVGSSFHDGLAAVYLDETRDSVSFIDHAGKIVYKNKYFWPSGWQQSIGSSFFLFPDKGGFLGDECGYKDRDGNWVIEPEYYNVSFFDDEGLAVVEAFGGEFFLIDTKGTKMGSMGRAFYSGSYLGGGYYVRDNKIYHVSNPDVPYFASDTGNINYDTIEVSLWGHLQTYNKESISFSSIYDVFPGRVNYVLDMIGSPSEGMWLARYRDPNNRSAKDKYGFVVLKAQEQ